jgi:hypothetical protein
MQDEFLTRQEASDELNKHYKFGSPRLLAKFAVTGEGPEYHIAGRIALYSKRALHKWAKARMGKAVSRAADRAERTAP